MAQKNYGNTWWGQQWLNALTHIDYDNRLPRGRSYANKGAVRDLVVAGGTVSARVQGSRPQPYRVALTVPPLRKADVDRLLDAIAADPVMIAHLLNRELDPGVLDIAQGLGIAVFPRRWQDLAMQCSCPDWAVPCKHLAAVIYLMSREIDGNPFRVFSLRGIDLTAALQQRGIVMAGEAAAKLPSLGELLPGTESAPANGESGRLERLDFSAIPELLEPLLSVLPPQPAFFMGGDFRAILSRLLTRVAKAARQAINAPTAQVTPQLTPDCVPQLQLDAEAQVSISGCLAVHAFPDLVAALCAIEAVHLADVQPEVAALVHLRLFALHLLARGATVPQIFAANNGGVGVRWLPAKLDPTVSRLLDELAAALPSGMLRMAHGGKMLPLAATDQASALCSVFLTQYIHAWAELFSEKAAGDKTIGLFFGKGLAEFNGPGEAAVAAGIHTWLARFFLARREFTPVLSLDAGKVEDFELALAAESTATSLTAPIPLANILAEPAWVDVRYGILQTLALLAEFIPAINPYLSRGAKQPMPIKAAALPDLLAETLPVLRLLGIRTLLPKALQKLLRPQLSVQIKGQTQNDGGGFLDVGSVFAFEWRLAVGEHLLTEAEFEQLVRHASGVVRFREQYVFLDPAEIERLRAQLGKPPSISGVEGLRLALSGEFAGAPIGLDEAALAVLRELTEENDMPLPDGLVASLRPYQQRGYAWLYRNLRLGVGSVIADDMGLGKTLQVIASLLKLKQDGSLAHAKALVIVPTSLLTNWEKEIARFAPSLGVGVFHGSRRELAELRPDVLLTTFGVARSAGAALRAIPWRVVIVDEAQNIKNPASAQTKAVKTIPSPSFIAMSGTPVENRLSEYWSIMDFANRGYLGNLSQFARDFANPIQRDRDQQTLERFKRVTAPFLLRRLKSDKSIISDLPDKIEQDQYCSLTPAQIALYQSVVQEGLATARGESDTFKRQGVVLQLILALKQICNHPAHYLKQSPAEVADSGKAVRFLELMDDIQANHEKVLVFTQFREMGELLSAWLHARYARAAQFLHGGVARAQRDAMVERFQHDRTERVLILSLKAGGTGLNLTAAANVIHYDLWWNPAVEAQATDRAYRIGQQHNVQVHRLITRATFEERINDMINAKRELAELTVGTGEQWLGNLNGDELNDLFTLGAQP